MIDYKIEIDPSAIELVRRTSSHSQTRKPILNRRKKQTSEPLFVPAHKATGPLLGIDIFTAASNVKEQTDTIVRNGIFDCARVVYVVGFVSDNDALNHSHVVAANDLVQNLGSCLNENQDFSPHLMTSEQLVGITRPRVGSDVAKTAITQVQNELAYGNSQTSRNIGMIAILPEVHLRGLANLIQAA